MQHSCAVKKARKAAKQGWPSARPGSHYDVVVIGASVTGLVTAWRLAEGGSRVALVASGLVGAGWPTRRRAWLHCCGLPAPLAGLVPAAAASYREWADRGVLSGEGYQNGLLVLAASMDTVVADQRAAFERGAVNVEPAELARRGPHLERAAVLRAWEEPDALVAPIEELPWDLAAAAATAGADVLEGLAVLSLQAGSKGWMAHVAGAGGRHVPMTCDQVVDTTDELSFTPLERVAAGRVAAPGLAERWLVTDTTAPLGAGAMRIGGVDVVQAVSGEVVVREAISGLDGWWAASGITSLAGAAEQLCEVLPELAGLRAVAYGATRSLLSADGLPLIGRAGDNAWFCGGLGAADPTLAPVVGSELAASIAEGVLRETLAALLPGTGTSTGTGIGTGTGTSTGTGIGTGTAPAGRSEERSAVPVAARARLEPPLPPRGLTAAPGRAEPGPGLHSQRGTRGEGA